MRTLNVVGTTLSRLCPPYATQRTTIMASIHKDIPLNAPAPEVWDAVRDFGALHTMVVEPPVVSRGARP